MKLATALQLRELDREAIQERGIPALELMEEAARAVQEAVLELLPGKPAQGQAAVFCGSGNNGGDGIACARMLFLKGVRVRAFLVGSYEKLTPDALAETGLLSECGVELEPFLPEDEEQKRFISRCHVLVDALFGVGLSREIAPDSTFAAAVSLMNRAPGRVVAADIASGVSADSGCVLGTSVKADRTITFTLPKIGQFVGQGAESSGTVQVVSIGIPQDMVRGMRCPVQTIERSLVLEALPKRKPDGHKGTFGKLLVIGGSRSFTGAPALTASAAVRSGCGLVYLGVPEGIWAVEAAKCSSAMPFPLQEIESNGMLSENALQEIRQRLHACDVLALGPGLGRSADTEALVIELLRSADIPVVLDADGINALEGHIDVLDARRSRTTILTPHDGEFARLGGDLSGGDRLSAAKAFAAAHGCILVLKGHRTIIAVPEGNALVNTTGNSGLAKGGSGDVLTGIIASLLCQGATPVQAAVAGVWLHGCAGDLAAEQLTEYAMTPEDVIAFLPAAFRNVLEQGR